MNLILINLELLMKVQNLNKNEYFNLKNYQFKDVDFLKEIANKTKSEIVLLNQIKKEDILKISKLINLELSRTVLDKEGDFKKNIAIENFLKRNMFLHYVIIDNEKKVHPSRLNRFFLMSGVNRLSELKESVLSQFLLNR